MPGRLGTRMQDDAATHAHLTSENRNLRNELLISNARLTRLQTAASAAVNAELLARQRYQSGLIDFRTVLDTQRTLLSAQDSVASTAASVSTDHVRLYKALGGGWPAP